MCIRDRAKTSQEVDAVVLDSFSSEISLQAEYYNQKLDRINSDTEFAEFVTNELPASLSEVTPQSDLIEGVE